MQRKWLAALGSGLILLAGAGQALAHARLVQSTPAADAAVAAPAQIALKFNEKLEAAFSGFDLTAGAAKTPVKVALSKDGLSLVGVPARPLTSGAYHVQWHAVSADGHRMTGAFDFAVK
jgi:methionine-rich copper-binding protein CopC